MRSFFIDASFSLLLFSFLTCSISNTRHSFIFSHGKEYINKKLYKIRDEEAQSETRTGLLQHTIEIAVVTALFNYSEHTIRRKQREENLVAIIKKAASYLKEMEREKQSTKIWKENLRRACSRNNMHKVLSQPPTVPHSVEKTSSKRNQETGNSEKVPHGDHQF